MADAFAQGLGTGLGVLTGIVVGVIISVTVQHWQQSRAREAQFRNLIAEMRFNINWIDSWLAELDRCKTASRDCRLYDWWGYFDLQSSTFRVAGAVFASGLIYEKLNFQQVMALQAAATDLSPHGTDYMNKQFREERTEAIRFAGNPAGWLGRQARVLRLIEVWESKLANHKASFEAAVAALDGQG